MTTEIKPNEKQSKEVNVKVQRGGSSDAVYGLGMIGAWIYFIGGAATNEERVRGFFKGLVWPVFLIKSAFEYLDQSE